ncbi:hypothetical protein [Lutibacter sp.]|uniref:hypothetical protein n=1 Tax=Lutibacter sp. TaxID=1925666 RepID=UPI0034A09DE3
MKLDPNILKNNEEAVVIDKNYFDSYIVDIKQNVERPPLAVSIGIDDKSYGGVYYPLKFGSFGNISLITGQEKSRKTFVKSLIEACTIGGKANYYTDNLDIKGYLGDRYLISIDTEQSLYDTVMTAKRVPFMVGAHPDNYISIMWREKSTKERLELLEWLYMESPYRNNLGLVMLDGVVDCVNDFNNQTECKEFTEKLMKYTTVTNSHLCGLLHLNPNSDKIRGHLGTILGQKCEMVMIVENKGDYSECRCKVIRGGKPFKPFTIRVDDDWMPYISEEDDILI